MAPAHPHLTGVAVYLALLHGNLIVLQLWKYHLNEEMTQKRIFEKKDFRAKIKE